MNRLVGKVHMLLKGRNRERKLRSYLIGRMHKSD